MSITVNPILVIKNNAPAYVEELLAERAKLQVRVDAIDADLITLKRLEEAVYGTAEEQYEEKLYKGVL